MMNGKGKNKKQTIDLYMKSCDTFLILGVGIPNVRFFPPLPPPFIFSVNSLFLIVY